MWKEFARTNKDLSKVNADFEVSSSSLIQEFESNDSLAAKKYNGKILDLSGNVKKLEKDELGLFTIILGDSTSLTSVRCSIDTSYQADAARLMANSSVKLRGMCTGFNKDEFGLGSDVILNRCVIIK